MCDKKMHSQTKFDIDARRRNSESLKWNCYPEDVIPMWIADMDFQVAEPIIEALQKRIDHRVFGYYGEIPHLTETICEWLHDRHQWQVSPEEIVLLPGVISGFNLACRMIDEPGAHVLIQTPVYPPFFQAPVNHALGQQFAPLTREADGKYRLDFDAFGQTVTRETRLFLLCNPHNPSGRVFRKDELLRMAEICLQNGTLICSDEIHADLIYRGNKHIPIASLSNEIAMRTITLLSPGKTFNIPGLDCAYAVISNSDLRQRFQQAANGLVGCGSFLGWVATIAAYTQARDWLADLLEYLEENRDYVHGFVNQHLPGVTMGKPEATCLAWLDCRKSLAGENPAEYFLEQASVALNDGETFGIQGRGFARLNFGCRRSLLEEGLERLKKSLA